MARDSHSLAPAAALLAQLLTAGAAVAGPAVPADCPPAGMDAFQSELTLMLDVPGTGMQEIDLAGPFTVVRGEPRLDGGVAVIDTEIVAMDFTGDFQGMTITMRQNPEFSSTGEVRAQDPSSCFLADSFFDVYVEVDIPGLNDPVVNLEAVRVVADNLQKLPALFDTYRHPPPSIPLVTKGTTGPTVATIEGESSHTPVQRPTFSIASGGSLEPATGYGLPKPPPITLSRAGLGLQAGDELDALSFGMDGIDAPPYTDIGFSVDPASDGKAGTAVESEAATGEQESSEYVSYLDGTNLLLVDGGLIVPITGDSPPGDDLDAITDQEATEVDTDDDQVPEEPVFLSLAAGSPTLTSLGASAADVLVTVEGTASVYATAADIGLQTGDDLNAMCLMKSGLPNTDLRAGSGPPGPPPIGAPAFDYMIFSLAPGSPTLTAQGHTAADLFITDFSNNRPGLALQPLTLYAEATDLGLLDTDNLNALKCLRPSFMIEVTPNGDLDGPGNGTGCQDTEVMAGVGLDVGLYKHSGDHTQRNPTFGQLNFFDMWSIQNPFVGDAHGPYAFPGTPAAAFMPAGDPASDVTFVGSPGDNCGLPHVHGGFFGFPLWDRFGFHEDPDVLACGHGVFVPAAFPIFTIPTRRSEVPAFTQSLVNLIRVTSGIDVAWMFYNGDPTFDYGDCNVQQARTVLIFSGIAITQMNLFMYGAYSGDDFGQESSASSASPGGSLTASLAGAAPNPSVSAPLPIALGPPVRTLPPPLFVPEPGSSMLGGVALLVLAAVSRRRRG